MKRVLVGNRLRPQARLGFQMRGDNPVGRPLIGRDENCIKRTGKITFFGTLRADDEMRSIVKAKQRVHVQATHGIPLPVTETSSPCDREGAKRHSRPTT